MLHPKQKYNTDKYSTGLIYKYERLLAPWRQEKIVLLEIGTYYGGSLRYFREYFTHPETRIIGVDNAPCLTPEPSDSFEFILCNQNDVPGLSTLATQHGPFDIIIDDGSHHGQETWNSFSVLWNYVKPGGMYLIEDWSQQNDNLDTILRIVAALREPASPGESESTPNRLGVTACTLFPLTENSPEDIVQSDNLLGKFNTGLMALWKKG